MTFRETLQNLFSRNIVLTRVAGDKLKMFDTNREQYAGNMKTGYNPRTRWKRNMSSGWSTSTTGIAEIEGVRQQMYADYDAMDTDGILASAMDVYADECTTYDDQGDLLQIKTENGKIKSVLHNLFYDVLNIDFNLWSWVRNTCKYGDFFLLMNIVEKHGVTNVLPVHPAIIRRIEDPHDLTPAGIQFTFEGAYSPITAGHHNREFEYYEIAHFRLLTDTNFLPYGKSVIEPARKEFKKLSLMEDAMLIHRIMRAPERRLFKIDVGNIHPSEIEQYISQVADEMKKTPYIDPATGDYNLKFNMQNMTEDYFMPVRGQDSGTDISVLEGLQNDGQIDDIEYVRNKMMAALKIPKAFLGYDEGVEGKATLAAEDIRFARTVERVQKMIVAELYKIALIHLYVQGFSNEDLVAFELSLNNPSTLYERQKVDLLTEKVSLAADMKEGKWFSRKYIYENIFNMTEEEWKIDQEMVVQDAEHSFRLTQIEEQGNDPAKSGEVIGTPYSIAALHVSSKLDRVPQGSPFNAGEKGTPAEGNPEDARHENPGRPTEPGTFDRYRDPAFGRDPDGRHASNPNIGPKALGERLADLKIKTNLFEEKVNAYINPEPIIKMLEESSLQLSTSTKSVLAE